MYLFNKLVTSFQESGRNIFEFQWRFDGFLLGLTSFVK